MDDRTREDPDFHCATGRQLKNLDANAKKFESEANGAFSAQTTAFRNALTGLQTAIGSLHGQSPTAALQALAGEGAKLKTAAANLQSAWSAKCR